nr:MAG TPA: hypothetical protein [Caudoviricetes sp.]
MLEETPHKRYSSKGDNKFLPLAFSYNIFSY